MATIVVILDFQSETILVGFIIYKSAQYFLSSFKSFGLSVKEKYIKIDFQDSGHVNHIEFPIEIILSIFDLKVTPILPTKFWVNRPKFQFRRRSTEQILKTAAKAAILDFPSD